MAPKIFFESDILSSTRPLKIFIENRINLNVASAEGAGIFFELNFLRSTRTLKIDSDFKPYLEFQNTTQTLKSEYQMIP